VDNFINILAKPVTEGLYNDLKNQVAVFTKKHGRAPSLATVLVGEDPASQVYVRKKGETCTMLGMGHEDFKLSESTTQAELLDLVKKLNSTKTIDGILVQKPLPKQISESVIFDAIDPKKDVDCFSPANVGFLCQGRPYVAPCTPAGMIELLKHYGISTKGKNALVIGRSDIVGKPIGMLLLKDDATVTYAHSRTQNIAEHIARAEIVVAAIGKPHFLKADLPWNPKCTVLDVGINRLPSGKLVGDVDYENVSKKVAAITPVPGGVGPMTIALLMQNTLSCAQKRMEEKP